MKPLSQHPPDALMPLRLAALLLLATQLTWGCTAPPGHTVTANPPTAAVAAIPTFTEAPSSTAANAPGCYYTWATQELPELSTEFGNALAQVDPAIHASAYAFGEDCRRDDGTTTFLAMETDFRVQIPMATLANKDALGDWIIRVMSIIEALPQAGLAGTRPGRVEFEFHSSAAESLRLNVEISRYRAEAQDLVGAALFEHFSSSP